MNTFLKKEDIWALSITATGRCNCNCSYCHFYARRDRNEYNKDIDEQLYDNYLELINYLKNNVHNNIQVRFSGGEPLIMGDSLFDMSEIMYKKTGIKPYVLTNGKLLDESVIEKSKKAHISAYLVSIENPFDQSEGAPKTRDILEKIRTLNCEEVNVIPAIMIVANDSFKHISKIADYVYDEIGTLPSFAELTYQAYKTPSPEEIEALYSNIKEISEKYYGIAPIRIFPYISPEFFANGRKNYLSELDIDNSIDIMNDNIPEAAEKLLEKLEKSYVKNPCTDVNCEWFKDCSIIKWLWLYEYPETSITKEQKHRDFCTLRKTVNTALYDGIMSKVKSKSAGINV